MGLIAEGSSYVEVNLGERSVLKVAYSLRMSGLELYTGKGERMSPDWVVPYCSRIEVDYIDSIHK
jgi:hypothetical protein